MSSRKQPDDDLRASLAKERRSTSAKTLQEKILAKLKEEDKTRSTAATSGGGGGGIGLDLSHEAEGQTPTTLAAATSSGSTTSLRLSTPEERLREKIMREDGTAGHATSAPASTTLAATTAGSAASLQSLTPEERLREKIMRENAGITSGDSPSSSNASSRRSLLHSTGKPGSHGSLAAAGAATTATGGSRSSIVTVTPEDRLRDKITRDSQVSGSAAAIVQSADDRSVTPKDRMRMKLAQGLPDGTRFASAEISGGASVASGQTSVISEKSRAGVGAFTVRDEPPRQQPTIPEQRPSPEEDNVPSQDYARPRAEDALSSDKEAVNLICGMKKKVLVAVVVAFLVVIGAAAGAAAGIAGSSGSSSPSGNDPSQNNPGTVETMAPSPVVPPQSGIIDPPGCEAAITNLPKQTTDPVDQFGTSVAVSRRTAVVGASSSSVVGLGSAYVYERGAGDEWIQTAQLQPSERFDGDRFGKSVAIDGDIIVVGGNCLDPLDDGEGTFGCVHVFIRTVDGWTEEDLLIVDERSVDGRTTIADASFANSVAIDDGTVLVGEPLGEIHERGDRSGFVYVFQRGTDGIWTQEAKLQPSDGQDRDKFGVDVDVYEGQAVVGAPRRDSGMAYVYSRNLDGTWNELAKLLPLDGSDSDAFGKSVGITFDVIVVGADGDDDNGFSSGSAYVYERNGFGEWKEAAKLVPEDGSTSDAFGRSVDIDGDVIVVGAVGVDDKGENSGAAYLYERVQSMWLQVNKIEPSDGGEKDKFGSSVAVYDDTIAVGAYVDEISGQFEAYDTGKAYVVELC